MFHKPAQVKPYAAIKGSERKQVLAKLEQQSGREFSPEEKNVLVPKSTQSAKCILKSGKKAQIYAAEGNPLYVVISDLLVPTVYTLSTAANLELCPTVFTVPNTLKFLVSGADFMIPGIYGDIPNAPSGSVVQIKSLEGDLFAVGITLVDLGALKEDKGKAVEIVNVRGDTLVAENLLPKLGASPASDAAGSAGDAGDAGTAAAGNAEGDAPKSTKAAGTGSDDVPLTTEEADDAFLYAAPKSLVGQSYPMPSATFAKLLGENFPYEHPEMSIKTTSWKKLPKFLKHLEKEGMLTTKERSGDTIIESISEELANVELEEKPVKKQPKTKNGQISAVQRYKLKSSGAAIGASTNPYYTASQIKTLITEYIAANNLKDKANVKIDDNLRKACGLKQDVDTLIVGKVVEEFVGHSTTVYHQINRDGEEGKLTKGGIPHITLSTERKGGNKVVTKVMGMEAFGFQAKAFAEHLRVACAGSTTVGETKAGKNTKPQPIVQIQGDHVAKVSQYLEKEGVKSSWIKRG